MMVSNLMLVNGVMDKLGLFSYRYKSKRNIKEKGDESSFYLSGLVPVM